MLYFLPGNLAFVAPNKQFELVHYFSDRFHNEGKILHETSIKLNHSIKYLNMCKFYKNLHIQDNL